MIKSIFLVLLLAVGALLGVAALMVLLPIILVALIPLSVGFVGLIFVAYSVAKMLEPDEPPQ